MKTCDDMKMCLSAWMDGELDATEQQAVQSHLAGCAACVEELRQLEKLEGAMKAVLTEEPARIAFAPFWLRVRSRIEERTGWGGGLAAWVRSAFDSAALAWAVPAIILLVIAAFSLSSGLRGVGQRSNFAAVESIDAHGRNVALLREDDSKTTVIWLYQNPEGENDSTEEPAQNGPSF
jgi:anti-sigma factor RsiW